MEFKKLFCAQCHQIRPGAEMFFFQKCSHLFCYPCFGTHTTCLICNIGHATDALSDTLLAPVLNLVSDIYSTFTGLKIETPGNEEPNCVQDALLFSEHNTLKLALELLPDDTPGTSTSTLRRTQRKSVLQRKNSEPVNKPDAERLIQPAGKRRRNQVVKESPGKNSSVLEESDKKALGLYNKVAKTELNDLSSPGLTSKKSKKREAPLNFPVEKNNDNLGKELPNSDVQRTNPEPDKKRDAEKLIQPAGKRRRNQVVKVSPAKNSSVLEESDKKALRPYNKVAKTELSNLTSPAITSKKKKKREAPLNFPVEKNNDNLVKELPDSDVQPTNPKPDQTPDAEKLVRPRKGRQRTVATESAVKKTSSEEKCDQKKLVLDNKIVKGELSNLTSPGITPKKNKSGETPLHVAVGKNKVDVVQELLENGADPNVQDFAGWTPLHDAVTKGFAVMITCLLNHGALADIPGYENNTALHIAVEKLDKPLVATLLKHGANPVAKNLYGVTPKAVAEKSGDQQLINLLSSPKEFDEKPKVMAIVPNEPITLFISLLKNNQQSIVRKFAKQFKFKVESDIFKASCVVSNPDPTIEWDLACVMAKGSHIISLDWCVKSLATGELQVIEKFFIYPEWLPGLLAAQNNSQLKRPGLFSGCEIKLGNTPQMLKKAEKYQWNDMAIVLNDLCRFVQAAGGKLINRMPDPENPFRPSTVPYHVQPGPMERCSQIVVYFPGLWEPALKFNMSHVKCLPIQWLMECILSFELKSATDCYFAA